MKMGAEGRIRTPYDLRDYEPDELPAVLHPAVNSKVLRLYIK